jgi:hypothetical protein
MTTDDTDQTSSAEASAATMTLELMPATAASAVDATVAEMRLEVHPATHDGTSEGS